MTMRKDIEGSILIYSYNCGLTDVGHRSNRR